MEMIRIDSGKRLNLPLNFVNSEGLRVFPSEVYASVIDVDGNEIVPRKEFDPTRGDYVITTISIGNQGTEEPPTEPEPADPELEPTEPELEPQDPVDGESTVGPEPVPEFEAFALMSEEVITPYDPEQVPETIRLVLNSEMTTLKAPESGKSEAIIVIIDGTDNNGEPFEYEFMVSIRADLTVPWVTSCANYRRMMLAISDYPVARTADLLALEKIERQHVLVDAFHAIVSLPLRVRAECKYKGKPFASLSAEERAIVVGLDEQFADAMMKAQVLEACSSTDQDPVSQARDNGIISMTVGESSQFYGSSKTLQSTMRVRSKEALAVLGPWLDFSVKVGRA